MIPSPSPTRLQRLKARLSQDRRGNVAVISALVAIPLSLAVGMGIDYTMVSYRQDQVNGFADSATLSGVTPTVMATDSAAQSQALARANFLAQLATVPNISYSPGNVQVTATDADSGTTVVRTVKLTYTASSTNIFSSLLGVGSLTFSGSSTAVSSTAPNIDFWMLLDDSGSMQLAATTADINTMVANTQNRNQGACAFACHESDPAPEGFNLPNNEDYYWLARSLGVTLRMDLVNLATTDLLGTAHQTQLQYNTNYRFAVYTMDKSANAYSTGNLNFTSPLPFCSTLITTHCITENGTNNTTISITPWEYYTNNWYTSTNNDNDTDTYSDAALQTINGLMPNPGGGSNNAGDTPQEVLFVVSDGLGDYYSGSNRVFVPIGTTNWCTKIKNRGIRIAFIYLTYNTLPGTGTGVSWFNSNVAPVLPSILPAVQSCASPGLFFQVNTDGDLTAAMTTLFQRAVATARLTQ